MDRVVNVKHTKAYDIYIGRKNKKYGLPESKWNNPFKIGDDGTRDEVIQKYEDYIRNSPGLLEALPELKGKVLGCWCRPKTCHGDVLIKLLQEKGIEQGGKTMQRTKQSNKANQIKPGYRQIGVQIKVDLWNEFRGKAIQQGMQAGTLLQKIIEDYLDKQNGR